MIQRNLELGMLPQTKHFDNQQSRKLIPELSIKWVIDSPMFEVQHVVIEKMQDTGVCCPFL